MSRIAVDRQVGYVDAVSEARSPTVVFRCLLRVLEKAIEGQQSRRVQLTSCSEGSQAQIWLGWW